MKASSIDHGRLMGDLFQKELKLKNWSYRLVYFFILLLSMGLSLLARVLWFEFTGIYLEEIHQLLWVLASYIMESASGNIVRLALSHQRIVL